MTTFTDADLTYYWLGPLGYLRQMPLLPVGGLVDASEAVVGGLHVGIDGTGTQQVTGHKRTWLLDWVCLEPEDFAYLRAWYLGLADADLRIVDPRQRNRLSRDGSSGGCYSRGTAAHTVTAGTVAFTAVTDYPAAYLGVVDGGVAWLVPVTTVCTLRVDDTIKVPFVATEQITVSMLVKGTLGAQIGWQTYDVTGASAGTSLASSVTLAGWALISHTFTPSASQVSGSLILTVASGAARTVTVGPAAWCKGTAAPALLVPGSGCPVVLITGMTTDQPGLAASNIGATIREA